MKCISHHILISNLLKYGLVGILIKWIHKQFENHTQNVLINGTHQSNERYLMGCNKNLLDTMSFNIFVNELDKEIEEMLIKCVDDNKLTNALKDKGGI